MTESDKHFWAVIPAAGVGQRMQAECPKQYLPLAGKTIIEHSLNRLLDIPMIQGAVVALDKDDAYWEQLHYRHAKPLIRTAGGTERSDSVLSALHGLQQHLGQTGDTTETWVLVHDAARPCVRQDDVIRLIQTASNRDDGGLLACPVRDTMKRQGNDESVAATIDRSGLWHALTPQMFPLAHLVRALEQARLQKLAITDDASAMELMGYHPKLVEGREDNIKVTRPFDLVLAEHFLQLD